MITTLMTALFGIFGYLISSIISLIPQPEFAEDLVSLYDDFLSVISFGWRFVWFVFGDWTPIFVGAVSVFLPLKYIVLPIVTVLRSVIAHGGGGE